MDKVGKENLHYKNVVMNKRTTNKERNLRRPFSPSYASWVSGGFSQGGAKGRKYCGNMGKNKPEKTRLCIERGILKKASFTKNRQNDPTTENTIAEELNNDNYNYE